MPVSVFVEAVIPKRPNVIVRCIYMHPCMDIIIFKDFKFNPSLEKLLKDDFNIDLFKFDPSQYINNFLENMTSVSLQF